MSAFLSRELAGGPGLDGEPIDDTDVDIEIVRTADVNGYSRLNLFVFNRTPEWCGSSGCGMELWISGESGEYSIGLDLFGYSDPSVRAAATDGYQDVTAICDKVAGERVYSPANRRSSRPPKLGPPARNGDLLGVDDAGRAALDAAEQRHSPCLVRRNGAPNDPARRRDGGGPQVAARPMLSTCLESFYAM